MNAYNDANLFTDTQDHLSHPVSQSTWDRKLQRYGWWVFAALMALLLSGCDKPAAIKMPAPSVTWAAPVKQTVQAYATFDATVAAMNTVELVARVPGYLTEILYKDGAEVKKGDLLFVIEQDQYQEQVLLNQAVYDEAKIEFDRQQTLLGQRATSQAALDQARSKLQQAQSKLALAKINLGYTEIRAPFDGVVSRHLVDVGNYLGSNPQGIKLAEIRQLNPIYLYFSMNEMEVLSYLRRNGGDSKVAELIGTLPVYAQLQGEQGFPHAGKLDYVASNLDGKSGALQLRATFQNQRKPMVPGLYAKALIYYGPAHEALLIPTTSVQRDQEGAYLLVVGAANKVERRNIQTAQQYGALTEVTDGLKPDDKVIINGFVTLSIGQTVSPIEGKIDPAKIPGNH